MLRFIRTLIIISTILMFSSTFVLAQEHVDEIRISVDDKILNFTESYNDQPLGFPEIKDNRTMIPLRAVAEGGLGYKVEWEQETRTAIVSKGQIKVRLRVGENTALVNDRLVNIDSKEVDGKFVPVDTKSYINQGRVYVPVRFLAEAMKDQVSYEKLKYDGKTIHNILINLKELEKPKETSLLGTAEYGSPQAQVRNIKKVIDFMGDKADPVMTETWTYKECGNLGGMAMFSPLGGKTDNEFFYVQSSSNRDYDAVISIKDWTSSKSTIKEILSFYLPNGADKLYEIIDDDYDKTPIEQSNEYIKKDIKDIIGDDGQRVLMKRVNGRLEVYINKKEMF